MSALCHFSSETPEGDAVPQRDQLPPETQQPQARIRSAVYPRARGVKAQPGWLPAHPPSSPSPASCPLLACTPISHDLTFPLASCLSSAWEVGRGVGYSVRASWAGLFCRRPGWSLPASCINQGRLRGPRSTLCSWTGWTFCRTWGIPCPA